MATATNGSATYRRRRLRTCQTMRHDSAQDGGCSSVFATSALAPIALRSWWPRIGSCRRNVSTTNTPVITANTRNGARHPIA